MLSIFFSIYYTTCKDICKNIKSNNTSTRELTIQLNKKSGGYLPFFSEIPTFPGFDVSHSSVSLRYVE